MVVRRKISNVGKLSSRATLVTLARFDPYPALLHNVPAARIYFRCLDRGSLNLISLAKQMDSDPAKSANIVRHFIRRPIERRSRLGYVTTSHPVRLCVDDNY